MALVGRMAAAAGDVERAMALATEALEGAESLGMAGVAARARALLDAG